MTSVSDYMYFNIQFGIHDNRNFDLSLNILNTISLEPFSCFCSLHKLDQTQLSSSPALFASLSTHDISMGWKMHLFVLIYGLDIFKDNYSSLLESPNPSMQDNTTQQHTTTPVISMHIIDWLRQVIDDTTDSRSSHSCWHCIHKLSGRFCNSKVTTPIRSYYCVKGLFPENI